MSDSGYEYFLKQWLLSGDERAREQCTDHYFLVLFVFTELFARLEFDRGHHQQSHIHYTNSRSHVRW